MWVVGYLVTPVLFHVLDDRALAGEVAGRLFHVMSGLGLAAGGLLLSMVLFAGGRGGLRSRRSWVLCAMLVIIAVGEWGVTPVLEELRQAAGGALEPGTALHRQFGRWHAVSSSLFLLNSVLGLWLVAAGVIPRRAG